MSVIGKLHVSPPAPTHSCDHACHPAMEILPADTWTQPHGSVSAQQRRGQQAELTGGVHGWLCLPSDTRPLSKSRLPLQGPRQFQLLRDASRGSCRCHHGPLHFHGQSSPCGVDDPGSTVGVWCGAHTPGHSCASRGPHWTEGRVSGAVCMYLCVSECTHNYTQTQSYTLTNTYAPTLTHALINTSMHNLTLARSYVCISTPTTYAHKHSLIHAHLDTASDTPVPTLTHVCTYLYSHTYLHTHLCSHAHSG